jgi:pyruvate/2-oxoacid:ferredoxin oxidoreductase alpha subunit
VMETGGYDMDYYRIIDADYAFVGLKSDLAAVVPGVADMLRRDGLRVGLVMLEAKAPVHPKIADLLAGVLALAVIESTRTKSQITPALVEVLRKAAEVPGWYFPGRVPRVYSADLTPGSMASRRDHLIDLAKAMRAYAPDRLILTADGLVKPAKAALRPVRRAAVA